MPAPRGTARNSSRALRRPAARQPMPHPLRKSRRIRWRRSRRQKDHDSGDGWSLPKTIQHPNPSTVRARESGLKRVKEAWDNLAISQTPSSHPPPSSPASLPPSLRCHELEDRDFRQLCQFPPSPSQRLHGRCPLFYLLRLSSCQRFGFAGASGCVHAVSVQADNGPMLFNTSYRLGEQCGLSIEMKLVPFINMWR